MGYVRGGTSFPYPDSTSTYNRLDPHSLLASRPASLIVFQTSLLFTTLISSPSRTDVTFSVCLSRDPHAEPLGAHQPLIYKREGKELFSPQNK